MYVAKRQFTMWILGRLWKVKHTPIPACVTTAIRSKFESEHFKGFSLENWKKAYP